MVIQVYAAYVQQDSWVAAAATEMVAEWHQDAAVDGEQDVLRRVRLLQCRGIL